MSETRKTVTPAIKPKRSIFLARLPDGREVSVIWLHGLVPDLTDGDAITPGEVASWFRKTAPNWNAPAADSPILNPFIQQLNQLRVSEPLRPDVNDPGHQRLDRVRKAIRTLLDDLQPLIDGSRKSRAVAQQQGISPFTSDEQERAVEHLFEAAKAARGSFFWPSPRKKDEPWHDAAALIARAADGLWRSAGRKRLGWNPTSPLVKLVAVALSRVGEGERSPEAISKALRRQEGPFAEIKLSLTT